MMWFSPLLISVGISCISLQAECQHEELRKQTCFPAIVWKMSIGAKQIHRKVRMFLESGNAVKFFSGVPGSSKMMSNSACGMRMRTSAIVGGHDAEPNSWPWQALLIGTLLSNRDILCGGTLISNHWVITAAHCVPEDLKSLRIFLGVHNYRKMRPTVQRFNPKLNDIYVNQEYRKTALYGQTTDIALIKLPQPASVNDYVHPACIPKSGRDATQVCVTLGWGKNVGYKSNEVSVTLKELRVIAHKCSKNPIYYCAWSVEGSVPSGICSGDSGGPLLCQRDGVYYVDGVVSHSSVKCDQRKGNMAGAYTNVTYVLDWIDQTTTQHA